MPELSNEDLVVRESLLSYFWDVLRRLGPVRINGPELQAELDHLSEEGKQLVGRHSDIAAFIGQSGQLVLIDDLVCAKEDVERARKMAIDSIVLSVAARNNKTSSVAPGPPVSSASAAPATVWNSQTPLTASIKAATAAAASASESTDVDPWLQLPKVDSLFNYDGGSSSSTSNLLTSSSSSSSNFPGLSSHLKQPDLSSPPPTIQRSSSASTSNGFSVVTSTSSGSSRFGGLGLASGAYGEPASSAVQSSSGIEALNRRLQGLSLCNADLLTQLANKERQLQHFSKMIAPQEELAASHEKLKQELEEAKKEIARLRALLETKEEKNKEKTPASPVSDNYLIISLQHQLESERLNSRNLKHQLELERSYSSKVTEKHNFLMNRYHTPESQAPGSPIGLGDSGVGGIGSRQQATDSFGLRGLLANTTSFRDDVQPTSRFSVAPPTSSAFGGGTSPSSLISKPPNSASNFSSGLHSSVSSSSSPPLQMNSVNFSNSFGGSGFGMSGGVDMSDFQRRMTGPSSSNSRGVVMPGGLVNSMTSQNNKP